MEDLSRAFASGATPVPQMTPLSKTDLVKALRPLVAAELAGVKAKLANLGDRLDYLEGRGHG